MLILMLKVTNTPEHKQNFPQYPAGSKIEA